MISSVLVIYGRIEWESFQAWIFQRGIHAGVDDSASMSRFFVQDLWIPLLLAQDQAEAPLFSQHVL